MEWTRKSIYKLDFGYPSVKNLAIQLVRKTMGEELSFMFKYALNNNKARSLWGYYKENKLVGICGLLGTSNPDNVWFSWFAVDPALQKKGLGKFMLDFIEDKACNKNYKRLFVETHDNKIFLGAMRFYKKHGFIAVGHLLHQLKDDSTTLYYMKELY